MQENDTSFNFIREEKAQTIKKIIEDLQLKFQSLATKVKGGALTLSTIKNIG
jgi:hypothetical protein